MLEFSFCTGALMWLGSCVCVCVGATAVCRSRRTVQEQVSCPCLLLLPLIPAPAPDSASHFYRLVHRVPPGAQAPPDSEHVASCQARTPGQLQMNLPQ